MKLWSKVDIGNGWEAELYAAGLTQYWLQYRKRDSQGMFQGRWAASKDFDNADNHTIVSMIELFVNSEDYKNPC